MTIAFVYTLLIVIGIVVAARNVERAFFGLFALLAAFEVNKITASALLLGSQEINCTDIVLAALFFCSLVLLLRHRKVKKSLLLCGILLVTIGFLSYAFNLMIPYEGLTIPASGSWDGLVFGIDHFRAAPINARTYLVLIRLVLFVFVAWCAASVLSKKDFLSIGSYAVAFGKIQMAFGLFEFVTKTLLHSDIALKISGTLFPAFSSAVTEIIVRGGIVSLQGFGREPSHFAFALTFTLLILLVLRANGSKKKTDVVWAVLGVFLMVMSGAFTAIVGLVVIAIVAVYYMRRGRLLSEGRSKMLVCIVALFAAVVAAICLSNFQAMDGNYYFKKVFGVFAGFEHILNRQYGAYLGTYDAMPRVVSIVECMRVFLERPVLGIGPGVVNPYSGVSAILSQYGIVFSVVWIVFLWDYAKSFGEDSATGLFVGVVILFGLLLFGGGYEYSFLWLLLGGLMQGKTNCSAAARKKKAAPGGGLV